MWQDILFMVGNFILGAALIPTILAKEKPTRLTSSLYGGILYLFCVAFVSLDLYFAATSVGICAIMWTVLLIQKWRKHDILQR